jgi:hypothetical protein
MRVLKEWIVTWTFSYTYFEGTESYLDILLCVFCRKGELLVHSLIRKVTLLSFKIRIGECPSNSPFLQNTYRRMSK